MVIILIQKIRHGQFCAKCNALQLLIAVILGLNNFNGRNHAIFLRRNNCSYNNIGLHFIEQSILVIFSALGFSVFILLLIMNFMVGLGPRLQYVDLGH